MISKRHYNNIKNGHRIFFALILCLFGFSLVLAMQAPKRKHKKRPQGDRVSMPMSCATTCMATIRMPRL